MLERDIGAAALGQVAHPFDDLRRGESGHIDREVGAKLLGDREPVVRPVERDDVSGAHDARFENVEEAHRADPLDSNRRPGAEPFAVHRVEGFCLVEVVRDRHQFGHHSELRVKAIRRLVNERVGANVDVLCPASHQMRGLSAGEMIAISANILAQGKAREVAAIVATAAQDIGAHDHPVADTQFFAMIFQARSGPPTDLRHSANNFVARDDRKRRRFCRGGHGSESKLTNI